MTKRVNNMEDPSPETKANVSGCESLHKQEKTVAQKKDACWLRTWCRQKLSTVINNIARSPKRLTQSSEDSLSYSRSFSTTIQSLILHNLF